MLHPLTIILTALTLTALMTLVQTGMHYVFSIGLHGNPIQGLSSVLLWFTLTLLSGKLLSRHLQRTLP